MSLELNVDVRDRGVVGLRTKEGLVICEEHYSIVLLPALSHETVGSRREAIERALNYVLSGECEKALVMETLHIALAPGRP